MNSNSIDRSLKRDGFTLIEAVAILLVIAVLVAVATTRMSSSAVYELTTAVDVLKGHIRYAQLMSLNSDEVWGIYFSDGGHYALFQNGSTAATVRLPGADDNPVNLAAKNIAVSVEDGNVLSFDTWGRPCTDAPGTALQAGTRSLTASLSGTGNQTITITQNTGYIP